MRFGLAHRSTGNLANGQNDQAAHRLEGSRLAASQLCRLAAGGSRERPSAAQLYQTCVHRPSERRRWANAPRSVILGSRLQPSDRTSKLQSGSPPGSGDARPLCLK
jgi:hypothetical protein